MHIIDTWQKNASQLIAVAAGRDHAELVVQNCRLVNVNSREILDGWEVAVLKGRFAYVGPNANHCIGPNTTIFDASGKFIIPGLCDGHMHIESGMLTPAEFAAAVIPHELLPCLLILMR